MRNLKEMKNWGAQFAERDSLEKHLGIEIKEIDEGKVVATMPVDDRTRQPFGILHGGASAALAETIGSIGSARLIDLEKQVPVGIDLQIHHLRPVKQGFVRGEAEIAHRGKKLHLWNIQVKDEQERLVASSTLKVMILDK